jgi:heme-degrading monooxygenase HmoA
LIVLNVERSRGRRHDDFPPLTGSWCVKNTHMQVGKAVAATQSLYGFVRVLSERVMVPGAEPKVKKLMESVVDRVRTQPGFVRGDVLKDLRHPELYIVLTEWESVNHLDKWLANPEYKTLLGQMNLLLGQPVRYSIFHRQREDVFLL